MIARSRRVTLSNGIEFETPALVPALSSMAMGPLLYTRDGGRDELTVCSIVHSELLIGGWDDALLVSAYDIHHEQLVDAKAFSTGFAQSRYAQQRFLIVDSGWYEKTANVGGIFLEQQEPPLPWDKQRYEQTVDELDADVPAIVVSWDQPGPYDEQIARAQAFFGDRPHLASTILLKTPDTRFHNFDKLAPAQTSNLCAFDIVGVTEKELGDSILERLVALANLRRQLDEADVLAPIHVFGGLDPLYTPLLFAAGAEIFDGLGWLRYAYRNGIPLYREAGPILANQVDKRWWQALTSVQLRNLDAIQELKGELLVFTHNHGDWSKIRTGEEHLRPVFERVEARLGGGRGR